jgi:hypothetical protein
LSILTFVCLVLLQNPFDLLGTFFSWLSLAFMTSRDGLDFPVFWPMLNGRSFGLQHLVGCCDYKALGCTFGGFLAFCLSNLFSNLVLHFTDDNAADPDQAPKPAKADKPGVRGGKLAPAPSKPVSSQRDERPARGGDRGGRGGYRRGGGEGGGMSSQMVQHLCLDG